MVPATFHWAGLAGDSLASNAFNWQEHAVPGQGDSIVFPAGGGPSCIIDQAFTGTVADITFGPGFPGMVVVARDLTATGTVTVPSGILNVNPGNTLSAEVVSLTGGQVNGAGALEVLGSMTFSNATIQATHVSN